MTSGQYHNISVERIIVERDSRQRRELTGIEELAQSIAERGLINAIVVTRDNILVAGERRLTAVKSLGWTHITCQYTDEVESDVLQAIELEENIKRLDIPWKDQCLAVQRYNELRKAKDPEWTQLKTAEALGLSQYNVSQTLAIAAEILDGNERVIAAPKFSVARGITERAKARKDTQEVDAIKALVGAPVIEKIAETPLPQSIINTNFSEWSKTYSGPRFNFIHCDFPYGVGMDKSDQGSAAAHGGYADSEDVYWDLCRALCEAIPKITTPSCHILFWFSMKYYQQTLDFFADNSDVMIEPFPLIWLKSDNVGILPDPTRGPRRIYETALLMRLGDRPVVQAVANAYAAPTSRNIHMSEKPEAMLRHFFRMLVDTNTIMLDPTCGGGSALRAAESLGAKFVVGTELNPEFAKIAQEELNRARRLRI